jgi:hypothetical protein
MLRAETNVSYCIFCTKLSKLYSYPNALYGQIPSTVLRRTNTDPKRQSVLSTVELYKYSPVPS